MKNQITAGIAVYGPIAAMVIFVAVMIFLQHKE